MVPLWYERLFGGGSTIGERPEFDAEILAHYEEGIEKERLLGEGAGRLEYLRTRELFARHLPPPAASILDVGGGAGAYALPLAKEGYLVDPVPLHVEQERLGPMGQRQQRASGQPRDRARFLATVAVIPDDRTCLLATITMIPHDRLCFPAAIAVIANDLLGHGLVLGHLGRAPEVGDEVCIDEHELRVEEVDGTRIARLGVWKNRS